MSLIHTCRLCGANAFDYLCALRRYAKPLRENPSAWMPWTIAIPWQPWPAPEVAGARPRSRPGVGLDPPTASACLICRPAPTSRTASPVTPGKSPAARLQKGHDVFSLVEPGLSRLCSRRKVGSTTDVDTSPYLRNHVLSPVEKRREAEGRKNFWLSSTHKTS